MRARLLFIVAILSLCTVVPGRSWGDSAEKNYGSARFLPPELLSPPPEEGSKVWKDQIKLVLQAQRSLPPAELAAIKDEQKLRLEIMTVVIGPSFTRERLPKTFDLLDRVGNTTGQAVDADKRFWHTRRPYLSDPRVKLYVDPVNESPAYPSGHTTGSRVMAEVLGMLVPEKRSALRARADAVAKHRVEAGVHYPADLEGGRTLAMLIVGALTVNEKFRDDLDVARAEIGNR
jgi:acid phosphatase (class A)